MIELGRLEACLRLGAAVLRGPETLLRLAANAMAGVERVEINEAFAAVPLAVASELRPVMLCIGGGQGIALALAVI